MAQVLKANRWTTERLLDRVVRYADLEPCYDAFVDCRTPGSEAKENFTIIGPGVSENPAQHVHIAEPHGFNIGGARQPPGCVNSQHSHDTAEVFVVHTGTWRFDLGEHGDDAQITLHPGDTISLPTGMFRGFTNIGEDTGFLWAVLGGDNPGRVLWAPDVFEMAKDFGLVLLENGRLVNTLAGETLPADIAPMPPTSPHQVAVLARLTPDQADRIVVRKEATSAVLIGPGAPLGWPHGFILERLVVTDPVAGKAGGRVLFVQDGSVLIEGADGSVELDAGDTMTVPEDFGSYFLASQGATVFSVQAAS